jgi:RNA polymerase sigma-70 factor, ECF subfamily
MHELVDRLYRQHAGALIATLARVCGTGRLELVEACVHDAFVEAITRWPADGVPDNPPGWLSTVARNRLLDRLRHETRFRADGDDETIERSLSEEPARGRLRGELPDDQLAMMFVACHPSLPVESQVALTLRTLCGLETGAIARALLAADAAVEKRLVRARQLLREQGIGFEVPAASELAARLDAVLAVLYLLFGEGYSAHQGERTVREELCAEAIRLTGLLLAHPPTAAPRVHALAALMLLQASRLRARVGEDGRLVMLVDQDRTRWDRTSIARGLAHLARSASGDELSEYHLEAGIAACHATAPTFVATDWRRVVGYYDQLLALDPSPVVRVNRAIALAYARGPEAGLAELSRLAREPRLRDSPLLAAATADLRARAGHTEHARAAYVRAIELAATEQERQHLVRRLAELA